MRFSAYICVDLVKRGVLTLVRVRYSAIEMTVLLLLLLLLQTFVTDSASDTKN